MTNEVEAFQPKPAAPSGAAQSPPLVMPPDLFWEMVDHARRESPKEACGLLAGSQGRPVHVFPAGNTDPFPVVRYQMDPHDIIAFDKLLDENGWQWLGVYHSHTFSEAYPSPTDIMNAVSSMCPGLLYLILSLKSENEEAPIATVERAGRRFASLGMRTLLPPVIRAFTLDGGVVNEVEVTFE